MKSLNIMMVEDNTSIIFLHQLIFDSVDHKINFFPFEYPKEALLHLSTLYANNDVASFPDYIFVDIHMPQMSGFEFVDQYNALSFTPISNEKLFLLSSTINQEDYNKADFDKTIIQLLEKPLTENSLNQLLDEFPIENKWP